MSQGDQTLVTSAASYGHPLPLIIASGDLEQNRLFFGEHKVGYPVLFQEKLEVSAAYGANATPSGYLIDAEGKIASEFALGAEMLQALANGTADRRLKPEMDQARAGEAGPALTSREVSERANRFRDHSLSRSKIKRDGLKAGTPAPDFQLPRLDGRGELSMSALRGQRVLIVFSSPHCGPCYELAPRLERFHRGLPELEVVMISNGEPDENRAKMKEHGLTFAVAIQQGWAISRLYGIFATPAAYLIDEEGVITRDVAVGADPIFNLLASITEPKDVQFRSSTTS
jgi:peroxiredoxin